MNKRDKTILLSDRILDYLLKFKEENPEFLFGLRNRDHYRSKEERLNNGFWFQGKDEYIFISTYKNGDSHNRTRSIGFAIDVFDDPKDFECHLGIAYGGENNLKLIPFHEEVRNKLNISERLNDYKYQRTYSGDDIIENLKIFLTQDLPLINQIVVKYHLEEKFFITQEEFDRNLRRTEEIRNRLYESGIESDEDKQYAEGEQRKALKHHKWYERNYALVSSYKKSNSNITECPGCEINILNKYGIKAIDLLELHHIIPLNNRSRGKISTYKDVELLCPTCHRAIHKMMALNGNEIITIEKFKEKINSLMPTGVRL